jgi:thiol-disulfide isomerase/thioredoxin
MAAAYDTLTKDFQQAVGDWSQKYNVKPDKSKRVERFSAWPGWEFLPKFHQFALNNPNEPESFSALFWIVEHAKFVPATTQKHYAFEVQALDTLRNAHRLDSRLPSACISIGQYATPAREVFLRSCLGERELHELRGMAYLSLAELLCEKIKIRDPAWFDVPLTDELEQHFAERMSDECKKYLREARPAEHLGEAIKLFEIVERDFADVPYPRPVPALKYRPSLAQVARHRRSGLEGLAIGREAPPINGKGLVGRTLELKKFRGKVVVVNSWATWCGPCVAKIPSHKRLRERFANQPFEFLGVNCDDDAEAAQKYADKHEVGWFSWSDPISGIRPIATGWHVVQLPSQFVLDHHGIIRFKDLEEKELEQAVESLLREIPMSVR